MSEPSFELQDGDWCLSFQRRRRASRAVSGESSNLGAARVRAAARRGDPWVLSVFVRPGELIWACLSAPAGVPASARLPTGEELGSETFVAFDDGDVMRRFGEVATGREHGAAVPCADAMTLTIGGCEVFATFVAEPDPRPAVEGDEPGPAVFGNWRLP